MDNDDWLAERFEAHRTRLRAVAHRMLGSPSEADDAVREAWLRVRRADSGDLDNLGGWLTTIVARACLDTLRTRTSPREEPTGRGELDPDRQALLADSVGLALLAVLDTLTPAERLAFVLHDMFAVPYNDIAPVIDRTPTAARQLAICARRRVHGTDARE